MHASYHQKPYQQLSYREKYTGNDHTKWTGLVSKINEELMRKQIGYIQQPEIIALRTAEVALPGVIPIPAHETLNEENVRKTNQYRRESIYKFALSKRENDMRTLENDFGTAIVVLKDQLSDIIKTELNSLQNTAVVMAQTNQQKYQTLYNRLKVQWGPHNQGHVDVLTNILATLKGDENGWRRAMQIFDETVTSLEMTAQRNGLGEEVRGAVVPDMPAPLAALVPTLAQLLAHHQACRAARLAAAAMEGNVLNYRPSDARLKEYLLNACKRSKIDKYHKISDEGVLPRNLVWTWQEIHADILALADKDALEANGLGKRSASPGYDKDYSDNERDHRALYEKRGKYNGGYRERSRSRSRGSYSASVDHTDYEQKNNRRGTEHNAYGAAQGYRERSRSGSGDRPSALKSNSVHFESTYKRKCLNCGDDHAVRFCQSTKCGTCGKKFTSIEDRKAHYWSDHHEEAPQKEEPRSQKGYLSKNRRRSPSPSPYRKPHRANSSSYGQRSSRSPQRKSYSAEYDHDEASGDEEEHYEHDHGCSSNYRN